MTEADTFQDANQLVDGRTHIVVREQSSPGKCPKSPAEIRKVQCEYWLHGWPLPFERSTMVSPKTVADYKAQEECWPVKKRLKRHPVRPLLDRRRLPLHATVKF